MTSGIRIEPVTPERWADLETVLGRSGGDGGCWDMFWRLTGPEYAASSRDRNRVLLRELVEAGAVPVGLLGYRDGEPAGWVSVGPRAAYRRLGRSRHFPPVDDADVHTVVCLRVLPAHRGTGVARALVAATVPAARAAGAAAVEAHPVDTSGRTLDAGAAFCGTLDLFTAAGFVVVRGPTGAVSGGCPRLTVRHPC
ncbi:MAG TPA: GNAT family N-acetyltransferase [Mycobacteriales bacterium]|jgi:GNAT superfamily N-acetyltransferase|nr:GNAT family N-acetyltransferase [Mycobacteriales bacterium]